MYNTFYLQDVDEQQLEEIAYMTVDEDNELDYKDDGFIELVLKMLGLMCDGQNRILQVLHME